MEPSFREQFIAAFDANKFGNSLHDPYDGENPLLIFNFFRDSLRAKLKEMKREEDWKKIEGAGVYYADEKVKIADKNILYNRGLSAISTLFDWVYEENHHRNRYWGVPDARITIPTRLLCPRPFCREFPRLHRRLARRNRLEHRNVVVYQNVLELP